MASKKKKQRKRTFVRSDVKLPEDTYETIENLEARLAKAERPVLPATANAVVVLKRDAILVAERAFQWRLPKRNMVPRHDHIFEMAKCVIRSSSRQSQYFR